LLKNLIFMENTNCNLASEKAELKIEDFLPLRPHRLISLWDMIRFLIGDFQTRWTAIESMARFYEAAACSEKGADKLKPEDFQRLVPIVAHFWFICKSLELKNASQQTFQFENSITDEVCSYQTVNISLKNLVITIVMEIQERVLVFIPPDRIEHFERDDLFGKAFHDSISPEINSEIKAAGNCLAAELNTAAMFHFLRAAELGMRRLAKRLGASVFRKKNRIRLEDATWGELADATEKQTKPIGTVKEIIDTIQTEIKIDDAEWDELIVAIQKKVDSEKIAEPQARKIKRHFKEYERLAQKFDHMTNDRNNIMHTHGENTRDEALVVLARVKDFMLKLADLVSLK
jgi:hypothetical protein